MSSALPSSASAQPRQRGGLRFGSLGFAVMITVLLVALIFAANQNTVIGWLLVIISGGWLIFAVLAFTTMRRGLRKVGRSMDTMVANTAVRQEPVAGHTPQTVAPAPADPMRDTKLDHSFKIAQVQVRVVEAEMAKGEQADREVIERALETITITASNARDMLKDNASTTTTTGQQDGPVEGTVMQ
ncbi:MAG: hypothetical protein Q4G34_06340 [Micrococcus sp.]|nr:hypothetical protein [Micrococcus sp.]